MSVPLLTIAVYFLAMLHGYLWSKEQRYKAVEEEFRTILRQIERERKGD